MVGNLPVSTLLETSEETSSNGDTIVIMAKANVVEGLELQKTKEMVILTTTRGVEQAKETTRYGTFILKMMSDYCLSEKSVTLTAAENCRDVVTYKAFTNRFCILSGLAGVVVGDAVLRPRALPVVIENKLALSELGVFYDIGICEQVYAVQTNNKSWPVSTTEIIVMLIACKEDADAFRAMTETMKSHFSYKEMWYKDLRECARLEMTRGWKVEDVGKLDNPMILSGERDTDVRAELVEKLRDNNLGQTLIWTSGVGMALPGSVQITFGGKRHITRIIADKIGTSDGLTILSETAGANLVNSMSTGLLQMVAGIPPKRSIKRYGSSIHPTLQAEENGFEVDVRMVGGLFATCGGCRQTVCPINGLIGEMSLRNEVYHIEWKEKHACVGQVYHHYEVVDGVRIV